VPKKVDPVTGGETWRGCISYVKLKRNTLNRNAYRLPRVSDLLVRVSAAKVFSKPDLLSGSGSHAGVGYTQDQLCDSVRKLRIKSDADGFMWRTVHFPLPYGLSLPEAVANRQLYPIG
jgi:hypothetical protein